jgi:hypothetical protein
MKHFFPVIMLSLSLIFGVARRDHNQ